MYNLNYYNEIKTKILEEENYSRIKDYSKENHKVKAYFEIGKLLYEAGTKYGENIIGKYAEKLQVEVGQTYNRRTLFRMKQFYNTFNNKKMSPLVSQLTWTNALVIMSLKDTNKMYYYIVQSYKLNLSKRQLQERIKNKEYERLSEYAKQKIDKEETTIQDFIKNPIIIKSKNKLTSISEKDLQHIILEDIPSFLKELGNNFSFIENEYKIKIGDRYNYIDLLLYNIKYKCYVVIELKVTELKKEYIGQIEVYMNYIDNNLKSIEEDKTIGIIICKKDNHFIMEYCSDKRILSREYKIT